MITINNFKHLETEEYPMMASISTTTANHSAFCHAAYGDKTDTLQFLVLSGDDSSLQSIKGVLTTGAQIRIGLAHKEEMGYRIDSNDSIFLDSNRKYTFFNGKTVSNKKIMIAVAEDVKAEKLLVLDGQKSSTVLAEKLRNTPFGIPIPVEWVDVIFEHFKNSNLISLMEGYYDQNQFDCIQLYECNFDMDIVKREIPFLVKSGKISVSENGSTGGGEALKEIESLTEYLNIYKDTMIEKILDNNIPLHTPLEDELFDHVHSFERDLFPTQKEVVTASVKALQVQKGLFLQGEMSTGKSAMTTAIVDTFSHVQGKDGYHALFLVPPTLTEKWTYDEIPNVIPNAKVHLIKRTEELIKYHREWVANGRQKPTEPTFFVISFTTMSNGYIYKPSSPFTSIVKRKLEDSTEYYKYGYYCTCCGNRMGQNKKLVISFDENEQPIENYEFEPFLEGAFDNKTKTNAKCTHCGSCNWTTRVKNKYHSFKEWNVYQEKLVSAIKEGDRELLIQHMRANAILEKTSAEDGGQSYIKVAAVDYIRRKMKNFFDFLVVDEAHEMKGDTARGNAVGSLVPMCKKFIMASGTLFGGKSQDVFYLLWRTFPHLMVKEGLTYEGLSQWNDLYGNVEHTVTEYEDDKRKGNKGSRGFSGSRVRSKVIPGISPYVFTKFMMNNTINVRLKEVWKAPVTLEKLPTILVDMDEPMRNAYYVLTDSFDSAINRNKKSGKLGEILLSYLRTGVSFLDNPLTYPSYSFTNEDGKKELVFDADKARKHIPLDYISPKELQLIEIVEAEMVEERPMIVYINDSGSSNSDRDVQVRLQQILESKDIKVAILRSTKPAPPKRSQWVKDRVAEGVNVIICNQELVKVGLDLLVTPTILFYQNSLSLFTINQAAARHFRIGQTRDCRTYFVGFKDTLQEQIAKLMALKNQATEAMNGDFSEGGLNAMLGDSGDLQSELLKNLKNGTKVKDQGWSDTLAYRTTEILENARKLKLQEEKQQVAAIPHVIANIPVVTTSSIQMTLDVGVKVITKDEIKNTKGRARKGLVENQLTLDLFAL